jgi:GT2 family glycosyltransferase
MKISVIIPTRHRNEQLAQCLARLAPGAQSLDASEYEVIVTDDGLQTTAEPMIRERFPWARWVGGPRRGPGMNRNNGARHAAGEWLAFTDDDCLPSRDWLAAFVAARRAGADVYEGKTTCEAGVGLLQEAPVNLTGGNLWACNFMARAERFWEVGGFDARFAHWCEDMDLADRIRRRGLPIEFVPGAGVDHPPRPRPLGWRAGLRWESRVLLWRAAGHSGSAWAWMPLHLLRVRMGEIRSHRLSWDSVVAAGSAAIEFLAVLAHLATWERRYAPRRSVPTGAPLALQPKPADRSSVS